mgnify:CR=1 FL=1
MDQPLLARERRERTRRRFSAAVEHNKPPAATASTAGRRGHVLEHLATTFRLHLAGEADARHQRAVRITHTSRASPWGVGRGVAKLSCKRGVRGCRQQLSTCATLREARGGRVGAACETAAAAATRSRRLLYHLTWCSRLTWCRRLHVRRPARSRATAGG